MNVAVMGAGGALGGHLVKRLLDDGHAVRAIDRKRFEDWWQFPKAAEGLASQMDLSLYGACEEAVEGADWIFNLAADMGGMGFIESHRADCMASVLINTNLLKAAARDGLVQRFFFSSSACVYNQSTQDDPHAGYDLLSEDAVWPWDPERGYGEEKLFSELMCRYAREDWGIQTRIARLHNVYGPYSTWTGGREKAPAAICRKVREALLAGSDEIEVWGDGKQTRSFLYVDDFVEGALRIMGSDFEEPVNLGSSEVVTIDELVDVAEECAGIEAGTLLRRYDVTAPQGVRGRGSNNTLLKQITGWEPSTRLRDGMQRLYDWIGTQT